MSKLQGQVETWPPLTDDSSGPALIVASSNAQDSIFLWRQDRLKTSLVRKNHRRTHCGLGSLSPNFFIPFFDYDA